MKNLLKNTVALALFFAITTGMANNPTTSLTATANTKTMVLTMASVVNEAKIVITDKNAQIIYKEEVGASHYTKRFNLKDLSEGRYFLAIETFSSSVLFAIEVNNTDVIITQKKEKIIKPVFRKMANKVIVNLFNKNESKVMVEIRDGLDNIVFNEVSEGTLIFAQAFNFEKATKGVYTILVRTGEEQYYENLTIK